MLYFFEKMELLLFWQSVYVMQYNSIMRYIFIMTFVLYVIYVNPVIGDKYLYFYSIIQKTYTFS